MLVKRIEGATHFLGAPENWNEAEHGFCGTLPIKVVTIDGIRYMVSAWEPTPDELKRLNEGKAIQLWISSPSHPVVSLGVDK